MSRVALYLGQCDNVQFFRVSRFLKKSTVIVLDLLPFCLYFGVKILCIMKSMSFTCFYPLFLGKTMIFQICFLFLMIFGAVLCTLVPQAQNELAMYNEHAHFHWVWLHASESNQQSNMDLIDGFGHLLYLPFLTVFLFFMSPFLLPFLLLPISTHVPYKYTAF